MVYRACCTLRNLYPFRGTSQLSRRESSVQLRSASEYHITYIMAFTTEPARKYHGRSLAHHLSKANISQVHIPTITKDLVSNIILERKAINLLELS